MAHDAFISFSHKDESTARAVCNALEAKGIRCWFAPRDILPTMEWARAIAEAIEASRILIVVFSAHSNESRPVQREVGIAENAGIRITQFRIDSTRPTGAMNYHLGSLQWLDASKPPLEKHLEGLAQVVNQLFLGMAARDDASRAETQSAQPNLHPAVSERPVSVKPAPAPPVVTEQKKPSVKRSASTTVLARHGSRMPAVIAAVAFIVACAVGGYLIHNRPHPAPVIASDLPPFIPSTKTRINPVDGSVENYIPAGDFMMGSNDPESYMSDSHPLRRVPLDDYYISKNLVTVAQYLKFCAATGHKKPVEPTWGWDKHADYPIVNVSWDYASAYAKWAGGSLPTEAQWEKAARGTDGKKYPWGNEWDPAKCRNNASSPSPVGSFPAGASRYGVLDMAGNVWEWCDNLYENTGNRVVRGGGWLNYVGDYFRCASRDGFRPEGRYDNAGFRCVFRLGR